ncbi:protein YIPF7 [Denticeps clupeoides]|uniref:Protein YIP n=1 Tax=Denticeps clupeoides TaxID=299321 RepID=A0AAY4AME9_9TELE|nr:protein YIPF7-like [Denticeps clupeoides]XP_028843540.1 protein YIPF7-like [Denticeps clupeoides]
MAEFPSYEQDFYQSGYYAEQQGQVVTDYSPDSLLYQEYQEGDDYNPMPDVYDPSMDTLCSGQIFHPAMPSGTADYPGIAGSFEEEPPLLEELGINFDHIWQKTLTVLNPLKPADSSIMSETDLTGPVLFYIALGATLLMAGKVHFGYVYGISALGCVGMYVLLNLMSVCWVSCGCVASVLGYSLLPMVALSALAVLYSLQGILGMFLALLAIGWCSLSASKIFSTTLGMTGQQLLVAYPCALLYGVFALLTVF